ncbi:hypothetical protein COB72_10690 [bacterium]|nr:MAG: hypothetical protein COB72_10690 [bacterium]
MVLLADIAYIGVFYMKNRILQARRGFSMVECAAVVLVLSMVGMTMAPSLKAVRSSMRGTASSANLQQIGFGGAMYAGANGGRLFGYSWRAGEAYVMPNGSTRISSTDLNASQYQNQEILQRWTGRTSGQFKIALGVGRIPHRRFSHLVLQDFLGYSAVDTRFIDPADANQFVWKSNPLDYGFESTVPYANGMPDGYDTDTSWSNRSARERWAFGSSYQVVPSAWQSDQPGARYVPVASTPHLFTGGPNINLHSGRNLAEVSMPGQKVWMFEEFDREGKGSPYFGYDHAQAEKLMFDGSVNSWASGDARPAIVLEYGNTPWVQIYVPLDTFPVPLGGLGDPTLVHQRYRWTFRGLKGFDYGLGVRDGGLGRR